MTTGMFPQEVTLKLANPLTLKKVVINSTGGLSTNAVAEWNILGASNDDLDFALICIQCKSV